MRKKIVHCTAGCALLLSGIFPAFADDIPVLGPAPAPSEKPLITPADKEAYSLMSLILGGQAGATYNSNIYRSSMREKDDVITTFSPKLALESNFSRHDAALSITPEIGRYLSEDKNDYFDLDVEAEGLYELSSTDSLYLGATYEYAHVAIGSFDDDTTTELSEPVTYDLFTTSAVWEGQKNLLHYDLEGGWSSYDYNNVRRVNGEISVQDDRDHDKYEMVGRVGYEVVPPYVFYVRSAWNDRQYDRRIDSTLNQSRDSRGYEAAVGLYREVPGEPYSIDVYAGYLEQNYDSGILKDAGGLDAGLSVFWSVTSADRLKIRLDRDVKDSLSDGVSSSLRTRFDIDLTHKYSEKLSTGLGLGYTNDDYQSNAALAGIDRRDHTYEAGANIRYVICNDISLNLEYAYRNRDSNKALTSYDAHALGLFLSAKY